MNNESLACRKVAFGSIEKIGDFCFDEEREHIYLWLPGTSGPDSLRIVNGPPGGTRVWGWDGNEDSPTLTPSINAPDQWHGHLKAGRLESV